MKIGDKVKSKVDDEIWDVVYSTFGFSLHRRDEEGVLHKTLGASAEVILEYYELLNDDIKMFPIDCRGCGSLTGYDLSIDDWTHICTENGMQIDDCDIKFISHECPLKIKKSK